MQHKHTLNDSHNNTQTKLRLVLVDTTTAKTANPTNNQHIKKTHTLNCIGRGRKRRQPLGRALRRVFAVGSDILIVMGPKTIKSARAASAGSPNEYDVHV